MTQKEMVELYLLKYGSITTWQAFEDLGILDLQGVIRNLKKAGREFEVQTIHKKNRFGKVVKFNKYSFANFKKIPWYKRAFK